MNAGAGKSPGSTGRHGGRWLTWGGRPERNRAVADRCGNPYERSKREADHDQVGVAMWSVSVPIACLPALGLEQESSPGLRSGVLMGMRIDTIAQNGDVARVVTTGTELSWRRRGGYDAPANSATPGGSTDRDSAGNASLRLERRNDFAGVFPQGGISDLSGDTLAIIRADKNVKLGIRGSSRRLTRRRNRASGCSSTAGAGRHPPDRRKEEEPPRVNQSTWGIPYAMRKGRGNLDFRVSAAPDGSAPART